jgi:serine/threonine-protein kinase
MAGPATDVFVSYNADDRGRIARLVDALEAEGFSVWWDARIGGGAHWRDDIQEHLNAARCVIVAWTKRSVGQDGNFVRDEAARAQRRNVYLPVCIDAVEPPLGFGEVQALPLKGWKGDRSDPRFRALADAVHNYVGGDNLASVPRLQQLRISRRAMVGSGATFLLVAGAGGAWLLRGRASANEQRIAVLPFENLSGDPGQGYFGEGMAEEIRGALARLGLQVIGRASSDAVKNLDLKSAASKLGVGTVLTGSVRRSPQMVRINVQLIDGSDGVERWSQSYDRAPGDAIKIQTDIATNVAQALSVTLGQAARAAITLGGTRDSAAQDLYLRARELRYQVRDVKSMQAAIDLLDTAIGRDPNYVEAYRFKADILARLGTVDATSPADMADKLAQAEAAAKHAIALEPRLGTAYDVLARIDAARFNFGGAVQNMRRALALSPEDPDVISSASEFIDQFGDSRKALDLADKAIARDPLLAAYRIQRGFVLFTLRAYPQAIASYRKAMELAPNLIRIHTFIAQSLVLMNRYADARTELETQPADDAQRLTGEAFLAARSGDATSVDRTIARMRELFGDAASYQYAQVYAQGRNSNRAFAQLDNAVHVKDPGLLLLAKDPYLDPIRGDPRYPTLLKRLNFPHWT